MFKMIIRLSWRMSGWKLSGKLPDQKKMVLAVAPHTHWHDIIIAFGARDAMKINHARFLGKKELFKGPQGWLLKRLGGTPIDRFGNTGVVEQVVAYFEKDENFILGISPEGTRKRVDKLKTGFYHMAKAANVVIVPIGLDYENKKLVIGEAFFAGNDEAADMEKMISFYGDIKGKNPEKDLRHLKLFKAS